MHTFTYTHVEYDGQENTNQMKSTCTYVCTQVGVYTGEPRTRARIALQAMHRRSMPIWRRMKDEEREKGTGVAGALVRHVKLTNRSGLASFRIPRGHRVGPSVCARSGIPVIAPLSAPPFTDQGERGSTEGPVAGPATPCHCSSCSARTVHPHTLPRNPVFDNT